MDAHVLDCLDLRRRLGVKHRKLKLWTGWLGVLGLLSLVAWSFRWHPTLHLNLSDRSFALTDVDPDGVLNARSHLLAGFRATDVAVGMAGTPSRTLVTASDPMPPPLSHVHARLEDGYHKLFRNGQWKEVVEVFEHLIALPSSREIQDDLRDAAMYALATSHAELKNWTAARRWTDVFYGTGRAYVAEPAYHLCRSLRREGLHAEAYYYYLVARRISKTTKHMHPYIDAEPGLRDYLLDYEKSILWAYVGSLEDRHAQLHGVALCMRLLGRDDIPGYIRNSIFSNLQYYAPHLRGATTVLRGEKSIQEEWRYSTPIFVRNRTLVRVVNYYVAEDGSYHVSKGDKVDTRLMMEPDEQYFEVGLSEAFELRAQEKGLIHRNTYIRGLEDTRAVVDERRGGTIYTLSSSAEYSHDGWTMNQVLGIMDLERRALNVQGVVQGPYPGRHDKNWVFAGGIGQVVYGWYPAVEIGSIDRSRWKLQIHTAIRTPASFNGMRGSTNGVMYKGEWWFVTHAVVYRPGQMRKYLHRFVVLRGNLSALERASFPFTFEKDSDVEYCLGLEVDVTGLTLGYSVRDRSSRMMRLAWEHVGELFAAQ